MLDQGTKFLAVKYLYSMPSFELIENVFQFTYHENKGAAWGILSDHRWVFMIISSIAIIGLSIYLFYYLRKDNDTLLKIAVAFFIGGGIGNMIDRIYLGYVIDFLDFRLINFPIFNVADSFVTIAAFLIILYLIIDTVKQKKNNSNENV